MGEDIAPGPVAVAWTRVGPDVAGFAAVLDADETARMTRFRRPEDRASYAVAHGLLRLTLARLTGIDARAFRLAASGMGTGFADILTELIGAIHNDLLKLGYSYEECAGMGATLSLGWFTPQWFYFGHLGDSRIYYLPRDGPLAQITHDHSHVGWLRRQGRINEREARTHPRRNALQQALGAGHQFIDPHLGAVAHRPGDRFLICSDGLIDGLWDRHLEDILRAPAASGDARSPAQKLVEQAVENSGRDNTTAVVVEVVAAPNPPAPA